jgi:hypothetical protein
MWGKGIHVDLLTLSDSFPKEAEKGGASAVSKMTSGKTSLGGLFLWQEKRSSEYRYHYEYQHNNNRIKLLS